jgi:type IV secretion system protein VirB10
VTLFTRKRPGEPQTAALGVQGERGAPVIARALSLQSRIHNLLAMSLMLAVGIAFLAWYYSHIGMRPARARLGAQAALASRAQTEMALPPLGPIPAQPGVIPAANAVPLAAPAPPLPEPASAQVLLASPATAAAIRPSALERRLSGAAFAGASLSAAAPDPSTVTNGGGEQDRVPSPSPPPVSPRAFAASGTTADAPPWSVKTEIVATAQARLLPTQRLLLPKGAFIDCTLETAIDSTLPGLTTCVTATDTFGADGKVVLLERGTKLIGETRGQVQQGAARVFVLWTEARTPTGVVVPLDSPGADELGRSGLAGEVNRHFWQRFGAALLISTVDGAVQAAVRSSGEGTGTVIYNPSDAQGVMTEVLRNTVNIAPTVTKNNGDRIQVLVARDVDFSSVYELRNAASRP